MSSTIIIVILSIRRGRRVGRTNATLIYIQYVESHIDQRQLSGAEGCPDSPDEFLEIDSAAIERSVYYCV